jgi:hypothetical protein
MSGELRYSSKRNRTYKRKFDHDEARRRYKAGESMRAIADDMGVTHHAVWRVVHQPDVTSTEPVYQPPRFKCPTCQGPRSKYAELCIECRKDANLAPPQIVRHLTQRRVILGGVELGRIVRYEGAYAVVEANRSDQQHRWLHFWDSPPLKVSSMSVVDVMPYSELIVEDELEDD